MNMIGFYPALYADKGLIERQQKYLQSVGILVHELSSGQEKFQLDEIVRAQTIMKRYALQENLYSDDESSS